MFCAVILTLSQHSGERKWVSGGERADWGNGVFSHLDLSLLFALFVDLPLAAGSIMGGRGKEELKNEGGERTAGERTEGIMSQTPAGVCESDKERMSMIRGDKARQMEFDDCAGNEDVAFEVSDPAFYVDRDLNLVPRRDVLHSRPVLFIHGLSAHADDTAQVELTGLALQSTHTLRPGSGPETGSIQVNMTSCAERTQSKQA
ncbi:Cadherin-13 [Liparis tanakae]|uniref:Cadherin-13 n=1 Tax=Liparis tanakae TaxID=230148 RepID=A0A4Z2J4Z1_9TELE|nr:Cadherin-13 [Liparis tanakae]